TTADVRGKALTCPAQVHGIHARQIVAPKTELPYGQEPRDEDPDVEPLQARGCHPPEDEWHDDEPWHLEQADQTGAADDQAGEHRERDATGEAAYLLGLRDVRRDSLFDGACLRRRLARGGLTHFGQARNDLRHLLNRAGRGPTRPRSTQRPPQR